MNSAVKPFLLGRRNGFYIINLSFTEHPVGYNQTFSQIHFRSSKVEKNSLGSDRQAKIIETKMNSSNKDLLILFILPFLALCLCG